MEAQKGVDEVLEERGKRYGSFNTHAAISQNLKRLLLYRADRDDTYKLEDYQREALEMIAHKLARIANGDPDYDDSWIDIAGYAQLVVDILHERSGKTNT